MTQTIPLRKYLVTGRVTRDFDTRQEASTRLSNPLPLLLSALPHDDDYDLRLIRSRLDQVIVPK